MCMVLKGLILPGARTAPTSTRPTAWRDAPLRLVANRPVVCHVLDELRAAGVSEVVFPVPAQDSAELRAQVQAGGCGTLDIEYLPYDPRDGFEQIRSAAARVVGDAACVAHAADGLLAQPLAPLVALLREGAPDLMALVYKPPANAASVGLATRRLLRLAGSAPEESELDLAGVWLLGPNALHHASGARWCRDGELDPVAFAQRLVEAGGRIGVERVQGWRRVDGGTDELLELNRLALDRLALLQGAGIARGEAVALGGTRRLSAGAGGEDVGGEGNRIEGNVEVHPTACVQASVIVGPAVVGAGALVLDSYIGPYTSIGADTRIEGAEIERSIILPGASITHIGGRLVSSVVGRDARIFRDFSLPRALRMTVGDGNEVALC
jgi:glucose-1-phosphate thymidylyltransferase